MSRHIPQSRQEVKDITEAGDDHLLYDAEDARFKESVGERIQDERERNNYTQRDLAEVANLSIGTIVSAEQGRRSMTIETLVSIASALKTSASHIYRIIPLFIMSNSSPWHSELPNSRCRE